MIDVSTQVQVLAHRQTDTHTHRNVSQCLTEAEPNLAAYISGYCFENWMEESKQGMMSTDAVFIASYVHTSVQAYHL